jgi:phosphoribosylglycinamide formyltransferase, formyltetrahydrofolate-dependent
LKDILSKKLVVFASGTGTTFEFLAESVKQGQIDADIVALFSDRPKSGAVERAGRFGIRVYIIKQNDIENTVDDMQNHLIATDPDLIILAGYNRILPDEIVDFYPLKIINTHPSLLPCFGGRGMYGLNVHRAVIESGAKITGCTVHFVTRNVDGGPIIDQSTVEVRYNDTPEILQERVKKEEKSVLLRAVNDILSKNIHVNGKRVSFS